MSKLQVLDYAGQRVLTTAQLAESYGTDNRRISENFQRNQERYKEGKHFFALGGDEKREFLNHTQIADGSKNAAVLYLWTEKGAWLHAKSLNTDEAWDAYEMLVDDYYRVIEEPGAHKNLSPEVKAIFFLDKKTQEIENRVEKLEVSKTIDYGQQLELQNLARRMVLESLGGKEGQAYRDSSLRGKVFSAIWRDFKDYFNIESYKNTLVRDLDKAKEYISSWRPQGKLLREIEDANQQLSF
ncbi:ORF6C domain-containing protein [Brevibacillus parabrevis]|uniref:ORF6C domain-containing protein n=1 Tax=Brevibacillus parabrevis TaxID=54914 RepID=UPI00285306B1|nr:ORF6C domain-containing protein [Brevibacillus parabrevis]MDR4997874.1 ORF6C domain-containing protein [Brevibacillus parabrevis]